MYWLLPTVKGLGPPLVEEGDKHTAHNCTVKQDAVKKVYAAV